MFNKVFVQVLVPEADLNYDVYLPINKKVGNIINLLNKAIYEMTNGEIAFSKTNSLINARTLEWYQSDVLLYDTDIRNGTKLILLS